MYASWNYCTTIWHRINDYFPGGQKELQESNSNRVKKYWMNREETTYNEFLVEVMHSTCTLTRRNSLVIDMT